jgi:XTP/dITP diphosphohydrolase
MTVVLATRNRHKIREMLQILGDLEGIQFIPLDQFPNVPEVSEDGQTLRENAVLKAEHAVRHTGLLSLAEDTGLEIDALGGRPGVRSARFAGEGAAYQENVTKVLSLMKDVEPQRRSARFRSVVAIIKPGGDPEVFEGVCPGRISEMEKGGEGFGYDPIFMPEGYGETFAEMRGDVKNRISHRARALEKAREYLQQLVRDG